MNGPDAPAGLRDVSPARDFLQRTLARSALLVFGILGLNLLVDPFGAYGTGVFEPIALTTSRPKLALYERRRPRPEVVVLGSSRSFTVEPAYIEARTFRPAFNAAVHGARIADYLDLARCFASQGSFPDVLVVGLGVEQVASHGQPAERKDPLANCLNPPARSILGFVRAYQGALTLEETWASLRALALEVRGRPAPRFTFAPDGLVLGSQPPPQGRAALERAVDEGLAGTWRPSSFAAEHLEPRSVSELRELLELCREQGSRVVIYIPPYHPRATARYVQESRFSILKAELIGQLASWKSRYPLRFHDFTDLRRFGGSDWMFYDAAHPRMEAHRLMIDVMLPDLD